MLAKSIAHLRAANEGYWQHFRFATTFGLLAMAAGIAALIHALIPGLCTTTASRTVRLLAQLCEDRSRLDEIETRAVEMRAFALLLILATAVSAPLWILPTPAALRTVYSALAYSLPLALLLTNQDLAEEQVI